MLTEFPKSLIQFLLEVHDITPVAFEWSPVCRYSSLEGIDVERLLALICKSFDKTLKQDYIASLAGRLHSVYLSEGCVPTITSNTTTYLWVPSNSWSFPKHFSLHSDNKVVKVRKDVTGMLLSYQGSQKGLNTNWKN